MTKTEKHELVADLTNSLKENPNFMVLDLTGMDAASTSNLRRKCFEKDVKLQMVKNKLIVKALEQLEGDYDPIYPVLKQSSSIMFLGESPKEPAKMLKELKGDAEIPNVKAAFVEATAFVGDDTLERMTKLKSKTDLLGEVIGLLQSPIKNVMSALDGNGPGKIGSLVNALEERAGGSAE